MALGDSRGRSDRRAGPARRRRPARPTRPHHAATVALVLLDRVTEGVAVVQELPIAASRRSAATTCALTCHRTERRARACRAPSACAAAAGSVSMMSRITGSWVNPTFTTSASPAR